MKSIWIPPIGAYVRMNDHKGSPMRLMTSAWLTSLRRNAQRRRIWFRLLSRIERSVVTLTIRCVDRIRSRTLSLVIGRIACKLLKAFKSRFIASVEKAGYDLAAKISTIAVAWGYADAARWRLDLSFIRHLGVNAVNNLSGWRPA